MEEVVNKCGCFLRFPFESALARVWGRQIEPIVIGEVKYFSSLGLHAVVVGGNVRFSSASYDRVCRQFAGRFRRMRATSQWNRLRIP